MKSEAQRAWERKNGFDPPQRSPQIVQTAEATVYVATRGASSCDHRGARRRAFVDRDRFGEQCLDCGSWRTVASTTRADRDVGNEQGDAGGWKFPRWGPNLPRLGQGRPSRG